MSKGKAAVSLNISNDVNEIISNTPNKSATVDRILKERYQTEEGIDKEISYHKEMVERFKADKKKLRESMEVYLENVPEGLKEECKGHTTTEDDGNKIVHEKLKVSLKMLDPDKVVLWTEIINKRYNKTYTSEQLMKIAERYG